MKTREIKFRGIKVGTKDEWVYGYVFSVIIDAEERFFIIPSSSYCGKEVTVGELQVEVYNHTVSQFTGLTDIHEIEIYKDDFLEDEDGKIYLVDFRKGSFVCVHAPTCGSEREGECRWDYLYDALKHLDLEVVDNPELISAKKEAKQA